MKSEILFFLLVTVANCLVNAAQIITKIDTSFDLPVVHINDFHARFEEINDSANSCKNVSECIGGFSRIFSQINSIIREQPRTILLNGGDNFQGTIWYTFYKWNVTQYFLNKLPFDAIVLGNHEFDDSIAGVVPFIKALEAPVVVSNIDDSQEPDIQGTYAKSTVIERDGKKIGIIGVITSMTASIANTGKLRFGEESPAVNAEAERLVREENVFTNIVLSHSGYDVEQKIAKNVTADSKIGLIVGGHSHSFLYTGDNPPGPDHVEGPYPTIVKQSEGKIVLVVQASAYSKYVGNITVSYDENGDVVTWSGAPIFLDNSKPQDEEINEDMKPWAEGIDQLANKVIGNTAIRLDQSTCRVDECTMGNFVTNAMVYSYINEADDADSWTYAAIAITNSGGIRTSIEKGNITYNDMITSQPFANTFDVSDLEGRYIRETLEQAATPFDFGRVSASVNMLQVSGIQVVYNLTEPVGQRVESLRVLCQKCLVPIYNDLVDDQIYRIITPSFITKGGDGFTALSENIKNTRIGRVDIDVYQEFLNNRKPYVTEIGGHIKVIDSSKITTRRINS